MNLEQLKSKCRWRPNQRGYIVWFVISFLMFMQSKTIPRQFCEIFDYYDYDVVWLNIGWLIITIVGMYFLIQYNLHKNYERKDDI